MFRGPVARGVSEDEWAGQVAVFARRGCDDTFLTRLLRELCSSRVVPVPPGRVAAGPPSRFYLCMRKSRCS